jgi:DNA-binding LacI/PurR family transcriptional regulator
MVEQPQQCQAALQALLAQRVDALLVNVPLDDEHAEQLRALASPVPVLFLDVSPSAQVNSLVFNAGQGAHLGVEHLLSLGHQHIALLSGPESSVSARARLAGWKAALARAGMKPLRWPTETGARPAVMRKDMCCCRVPHCRMPFWWRTIKWRSG